MQQFGVSTWKQTPFLRILLPLIAGILFQFHLQLSPGCIWLIAGLGIATLLLSKTFTLPKLYFLRWIAGIGFNLLFFGLGAILLNFKNIENDPGWINHHYEATNAVIVTIQEPLVEKPKSYKALAVIESIIKNDSIKEVRGNMLLYFQKDSTKPTLKYGSQLIIYKPLQPITNSGNPGGFDYKRYCAFQDIYHQAFLKTGDYKILSTTKTNWLNQSLISARLWVLTILRKYIKEKNEVAVAEALLIGYRDDLDKELVQSYSNTGVVHIIAISGLHLGMIYGVMVWMFGLFKKRKWNRFIKPITILPVLWLFTFIAGAVPSILRSAVMFTCIIVGESMSRKTSIYNTLSASAFILLLINPFFLWDVGFQLSFAAVLSIIAFSKPVAKWFYFQNKLLSGTWKLAAISLAAQVLTLPIVLFHFHQFPNLFLLTNIIIVPLSGLILFAEILLLLLSFIPFLAELWGKAVEWMIWIMNSFIERTDRIPWAVTDGIQITIPQSLFIFGTIIFGAIWLLQRNKQMLFASALSLIGYIGLRSIDVMQVNQQQKLIVYNVPQHTAIDIVEGNNYIFYGDSSLLADGFLRNFHLRPSRIVNRISAGVLPSIKIQENLIKSTSKKVIILDQPLSYEKSEKKTSADVIIITKNPRLYINQLTNHYKFNLLVFDATNPLWKIRLWKKDCDSLHLRHYSVPEQGAFEMDL
jgi:competence protein ComEC